MITNEHILLGVWGERGGRGVYGFHLVESNFMGKGYALGYPIRIPHNWQSSTSVSKKVEMCYWFLHYFVVYHYFSYM